MRKLISTLIVSTILFVCYGQKTSENSGIDEYLITKVREFSKQYYDSEGNFNFIPKKELNESEGTIIIDNKNNTITFILPDIYGYTPIKEKIIEKKIEIKNAEYTTSKSKIQIRHSVHIGYDGVYIIRLLIDYPDDHSQFSNLFEFYSVSFNNDFGLEPTKIQPEILNNSENLQTKNEESNSKTLYEQQQPLSKTNSSQGSELSFSLSGRTVSSLPKPKYPGDDEGLVIVKITVDKFGKVVAAESGTDGTTIMNQKFWEETKQAALRAKFNADNNAPAYQQGTITYRFVLD